MDSNSTSHGNDDLIRDAHLETKQRENKRNISMDKTAILNFANVNVEIKQNVQQIQL